MTLDAIVTWIIVSGIPGLLAQWLVDSRAAGCIGTIVIGILRLSSAAGSWTRCMH